MIESRMERFILRTALPVICALSLAFGVVALSSGQTLPQMGGVMLLCAAFWAALLWAVIVWRRKK